MTRVYVDTTVLAYALGAPHPRRDACRALLTAISTDALAGETSVDAIQELVHIRRRRTRGDAAARGRDYLEVFREVHDVNRADMQLALDLLDRHERLDVRDAIHAAVAFNRGIGVIVSSDRDFDGIPRLERVDPSDEARLSELIGAD